MRFHKQIINSFAILFLCKLVHAEENVPAEEKVNYEQFLLTPGPLTGKYDKADLDQTYNQSTEIHCTGKTCVSTSSEVVLLDEGKVTISKSGTYIFDGELNGQLNIDAKKDDLVHLVLRNATISSDFGPAIYGEKCKKLIITTEGQNFISDSIHYPEDATTTEGNENEPEDGSENKKKAPNACIFIKSNLTFNGNGSLDVAANFNEGIRSKKNLKFISGNFNVVSKGNSIKAKESLSIKGGEFNIDSGKSAIKVTKSTDPDEGFIVIDGGKMTIKAKKDGIHAETHLTVNDGIIKIIKSEEGIEGQMVDITGGDIYVDCSNDCINAGLINAKSADYEGKLEEKYMNEQIYINITGGKVDIKVEGMNLDGIDSNGSIYVGGTAKVYGSTAYGGAFGHTAAVDSDGVKLIDFGSTVLITAPGKFPTLEELQVLMGQNLVPEEENTEKAKRSNGSEDGSETSDMSDTEENVDATDVMDIQELSEMSDAMEVSFVVPEKAQPTEASVVPEKAQPTEASVVPEKAQPTETLVVPETTETSVVPENSQPTEVSVVPEKPQPTEASVVSEEPQPTESVVVPEEPQPTESLAILGNEATTESVDNPEKEQEITVEYIMKLIPFIPLELATEIQNNLELYAEGGLIFKNGSYIYDQSFSKISVQPYVRFVFDMQPKNTPIVIKDSKEKVVFEYTPRAHYAIVFFTSPDIVEGETYTVSFDNGVTSSVVATVDPYPSNEN
ncbi:hypothetical protein PIROE2DRAFT_16868 [Piromyces sp. E2]|nr:hypothetical protein PIROE2DRAFT_16868 [Piromyces sp. E2]|eukprot:OUM57980.1 hypothetical protein PIROE2DRAFT_16868 [Piromyces sp. E2]